MLLPNRKLSVMSLIAFLFVTTSVFAGPGDNKKVEKAIEAVENAAPDDWRTLAESAEVCIRKNVHLKEASEWLQKSIEIKETPYNLSVMGDYFAANNLPDKAANCYIKSMQLALAEDINANTEATQNKLLKVQDN